MSFHHCSNFECIHSFLESLDGGCSVELLMVQPPSLRFVLQYAKSTIDSRIAADFIHSKVLQYHFILGKAPSVKICANIHQSFSGLYRAGSRSVRTLYCTVSASWDKTAAKIRLGFSVTCRNSRALPHTHSPPSSFWGPCAPRALRISTLIRCQPLFRF
jgi:hypothetical protein